MNSRRHLGHTAKKRFGQNFLCDDHVIARIVQLIHPRQGQNLLEIGPGLGALTDPVCEVVDQLHVIEIDRDLAKRLRQHPFHASKLHVFEQDALNTDFAMVRNACAFPTEKLRVYGNLPYNISTPLIFHLFNHLDNIADMHFMLQKEVVDRLAATPGSKDYGRLSVMAQYYCEIVPVLDVPPESFRPAPKVMSAVVRLIPHAKPPVCLSSVQALNKVCMHAFGQRRKTLRNSLGELLSGEQLAEMGIDPSARAETLSLNAFAQIANKLAQQELLQ